MMTEDPLKKWVGGVCIKDGAVFLIHRINKSKKPHLEYFVFPGKAVGDDESLENALTEYFRNISFNMKLGKLFYSKETSDEDEESEYYYVCEHTFGEPILTPYEEEGGEQYYDPVWVSLDMIENLIIYPESVKQKLLEQRDGILSA